jgi:hypothetical protein
VSGSIPTLGSGDPHRAVPLFTSPSEYPIWTNNEGNLFITENICYYWNKQFSFILGFLVPNNSINITYRYSVYSGGKFKRWEGEGQLFRIISSKPDGLFLVISDELDVDGSKIMLNSDIPLSITKKSKSFRREQFEWANKPKSQSDTQLDGVIIVSFFLPVILRKDGSTGKWSAIWDKENILSFQTKLRVSWVGCVRHSEINTRDDERAVAAVLQTLNCYPVFINKKSYHDFYDIFCKQTLWPVLHHVAGVYGHLNSQDMRYVFYIPLVMSNVIIYFVIII